MMNSKSVAQMLANMNARDITAETAADGEQTFADFPEGTQKPSKKGNMTDPFLLAFGKILYEMLKKNTTFLKSSEFEAWKKRWQTTHEFNISLLAMCNEIAAIISGCDEISTEHDVEPFLKFFDIEALKRIVPSSLNSKPNSDSTITNTKITADTKTAADSIATTNGATANAASLTSTTLAQTLTNVISATPVNTGASTITVSAAPAAILLSSTTSTGISSEQKMLDERIENIYQRFLPDLERFFIENEVPKIISKAEKDGQKATPLLEKARERFLRMQREGIDVRMRDPDQFYTPNFSQEEKNLFLDTLFYKLNLSPDNKPTPRTIQEIENEGIVRTVGEEIYDEISRNPTTYNEIFGQTPLNDYKKPRKNYNLCCALVAGYIACDSPSRISRFPFTMLGEFNKILFKLYKPYPKEKVMKRVSELMQNATVQPNTAAATATITTETTDTRSTLT